MSDYDTQQTAFDDWLKERTQRKDIISVWEAFQQGWDANRDQLRAEIHQKFRITQETLAANRAQVDRARKPLHCEDIAYGLAKVNTAALSHVMGVTDDDSGNGEQGTSGTGCIPGNAKQDAGTGIAAEAQGVVSGEESSAVSGGHVAEGASGEGFRYDGARRAGVRRFRVKLKPSGRYVELENSQIREIQVDGTVADISGILDEHDIAVALDNGWWEEIPVEEPANAN
jgi:hypothetical protein